jgi:hypothetical protein
MTETRRTKGETDMAGSADFAPSLSAAERIEILEAEDKLAHSREMEQRAFLREQEERRTVMEEGLRIRKDLEERQRLAEIKKKEETAAEKVTDDPLTVRKRRDVDNRIASMWSNISTGVGSRAADRPK